MKEPLGRVGAIARREWAAYFRTPVGWVVAALFLTLQGVVFWMFIQFLGRPDAPPGGVMEFFFGGTILYWIALALLATVVPMRLVAEERRSGTLEPLLTAPVSPAEVVVGKWLGALLFFVGLWMPTLLYLGYLRLVGASLDAGSILSGYLGTLLLGGAALALGLLASALTRHQIAAAAASFVAFFLTLLIGTLETEARTPGLAATLRRLSLFRIMEDFGHGLVDSRHVTLLVSVTVLGLLGAIWAVGRLRGPLPEDAPRARRLPARLVPPLVLLIAAMGNHLAGRHYLRGDWTRDRLYDLSDKTIAILRALPRPVELTVVLYPKRASERARATAGFVRELVERASRTAGGTLRVTFLDPDRDPPRAEALAKRHGIGAYEMGQGVLVLTSGSRAKVVTSEELVEPEVDLAGEPGPAIRAWRGEAAFVSALLAVTSDDKLRICFSKGHGEPDIDSLEDGGYASFAERLKRDGDEVRAIERLDRIASEGCGLVVLAEPTRAFSAGEIAALDRFVDRGGRVLAMIGPVFTADGTAFAQTGLEPFAARRGVVLGENLVVDPEHASDVEGPSVWAAGPDNYAVHPLTDRFGGRLTYWPRTREIAPRATPASALDVAVLVRSSPAGWGETDLPTIRGEADLTFDPSRDRKGPVSVAVAVAGTKGRGPEAARLVFLGTGRLVMNYRLAGLMLRDYDLDFVLSTIAWLTDREARIGIGPKVPGKVALTLTESQVDWAFRLFALGLPLLALGAGVIAWARRRV